MGKPKQSKTAVKEDPIKVKVLLGKAIMYVGMGGKTFSCPSCDRTFSKGIVYEEKGIMFCSRRCIK
jgi:hypothetical protein